MQWPDDRPLTLFQYTAAVKTSALDPTAKSLETLSGVFKKDPKLATILNAPTLSVSDKQQVIAELQKHIGSQDKEGIVKNLLETLAANNRLGALEGVAEKFAQLISAQRGEIELVVTSAAVGQFHFSDLQAEPVTAWDGSMQSCVRRRKLYSCWKTPS